MLSPQLQLAELGYKVFPCVGKKPLTTNGLHAATTDADQIEQWSEQWPNANWAIQTDGLLVVDVDPLDNGANTWPEDYDKALDLAAAPISLTPRGGKHYFFRQPLDANIGSTVCKLAEHVDTRANGGYVVAPPSVNDGKSYRWLAGELDLRPDDLPLPPAWLLAALTGVSRPKVETPTDANKIPSGQRNAALTSMAGYLRRAGHTGNEMFALLSEVNQNRCEPPLSENEIRNIAKSVGRYAPDEITTAKIEHWQEQDRAHARPVLVNLGDVEPQPVRWLWQDRIALGKLTLIAGEPGQGKSTMLADISARVTTGKLWPDAAENQTGSVVFATPGSVVLLSAEDDIADTIRPRLDAAGADVRKVSALQGIRFGDETQERCFNLENDLPVLEQAIQASPDCRLIIIDPVSSYMGQVDSHKNADVRGMIAPLAQLASRYSVAVVLVTHFSKGTNRKAMHAPTGSIAYIAACRAAWAVVADRNDPDLRLFVPIKNNLAKDVGGLAFRVVSRDVNGESVGAIDWEPGKISTTADEAMSDEPERGESMLDLAMNWLIGFLRDGPRPADEVLEAAEGEGYSLGTIKRAKVQLHVASRKDGFQGKTVWALRSLSANPAQAPTHSDTCA